MTPGHQHVAVVATQGRDWFAARHAVTTTVDWTRDDDHLLTVTAACACADWSAEGTVNPLAPAYDPETTPTRLRTLHRDHVTDLIAAHRYPDTMPRWGAA